MGVYKRWLWVILPLAALLLVCLLREPIAALGDLLPSCIFYEVTGWFCPGCGNTRAVQALLQGRVLTSLYYNITPLLLASLVGLLYLEQLLAVFGHPRRLLTRRPAVWYTVIAAMMVYFVVRNPLPFLAP